MPTQPARGEGARGGHWLVTIGLAIIGFLLVYLVFPGFVLGILIQTGHLDRMNPGRTAETLFAPVIWLSDHVRFLSRFYEWQVEQIVHGD